LRKGGKGEGGSPRRKRDIFICPKKGLVAGRKRALRRPTRKVSKGVQFPSQPEEISIDLAMGERERKEERTVNRSDEKKKGVLRVYSDGGKKR